MELRTAVERHNEIAPWTQIGVARFVVYCEVDDTQLLKAEDAAGFPRALAEEGYAPLTIRHYRNTANAFLRWLLQENLVAFDAEALRQAFREQAMVVPKVSLGSMEAPKESEVSRLIEAAYAAAPRSPAESVKGRMQHLVYLRNIAIVEMLRATGIRPGELVQLRRQDLDLEREIAYAPDGRILYFDLRSWGALVRYLLARRDPADPLLAWKIPVFARHDTARAGDGLRPLHRRRISELLQKLRGVEGLTPRSLRVRFGQRVLEATADERGTARLLGLRRMKSMRRYGKE